MLIYLLLFLHRYILNKFNQIPQSFLQLKYLSSPFIIRNNKKITSLIKSSSTLKLIIFRGILIVKDVHSSFSFSFSSSISILNPNLTRIQWKSSFRNLKSDLSHTNYPFIIWESIIRFWVSETQFPLDSSGRRFKIKIERKWEMDSIHSQNSAICLIFFRFSTNQRANAL